MDLTTRIMTRIVCSATLTADLDAEPLSKLDMQFSDTLADGVAVDQADLMWFDAGTMIASATDDIDLDTSLTDVFGVAADFARVKGIMFKNTSTTASVLALGPHADANGWQGPWTSSGGVTGAEAILVRAGGAFMIFTPDATAWAVGAGATDVLEVVETSVLAATYEIAIVGATA